MQLLEIPFDNSVLRALHSPAESDSAVIFIHGLEGSTVYTKFRRLERQLRSHIHVVRFDCIGQGMSDGEFEHFTIKSGVDQISAIIEHMKFKYGITKFSFAAHSLGGVMAVEYMHLYEHIQKALLISPALNQRGLLRYLFAKRLHPNKHIEWNNYQEFAPEKLFLLATNRKVPVSFGFLDKKFFKENRNIDYNKRAIAFRDKLFLVHGTHDDTVPIQSNSIKPNIIVSDGDHHLERPKMIRQWLKQGVKFLLG
ncbi:MAG: alpha/beta fold hydrolase [Patescibacteria group bacterium]